MLISVYGSSVVQNWSRVFSNWLGGSQIGLVLLKLVELCKIVQPISSIGRAFVLLHKDVGSNPT